ncbi:permease [Brachybacterium endophyticum]|uniref:Permease n=1 Tax=Brachybacterium endophyticum TaxID=2182385 RepID=A0A2U2RKQ2_9MICO|nr:GntP family permease [Brachybacterium endophyticum]PWH06375.1 permease [Brachybacterium endophyticum]
MDNWSQTLGAGPLLGIAAVAVALILFLVIKVRLHAFLVLVLVSLLTALATGIPTGKLVDVLVDGFGSTLGEVALLIGFGAVLGRLIESSGGAKVVAEAMVARFGEKRAAFALGLTSLLLGFPIFFDAGLVVMLPIIFAVARRLGGKNLLLYGLSAAAAFSVMHVFVPPHPGPVAASDLFGANLGVVLLVGLVIAFPVWFVSGYLWATVANKRTPLLVPDLFGTDEDQPATPPKVSTVLGVVALPLVLILLNTGLDALGTAGVVDSDAVWVQGLRLLGNSPVALLITVLVAMLVLGKFRGQSGSALEKLVESTLGQVASVMLITGAGGMFGAVLQASGIGDALASTLNSWGMPIIVAAYVIALALRLAQGSATVALVTTGGLLSPAVIAGDFGAVDTAAITLAAAAGSVFAGHVNDSGFWLVGRLMNMDVTTTLKTWTVQQAIESLVGFAFVLVVYAIF